MSTPASSTPAPDRDAPPEREQALAAASRSTLAASLQGDLRALIEAGGGEVRFDEPMSRHTTLRIGGPVDAWVAPASTEAVVALRSFLHERGVPGRALGSGSNLLVEDRGVRGVLIASERLRAVSFSELSEGRARVLVGAGVSTGKLLSEATRRGLGGVEFLGGVPGSVGGGLVMNAGTLIGEFTRVTTRVRSVDARGRLIERDHAACGFVYRGSAIPAEEMIVEGELALHGRARAEIEADVRALRDRRKAREPHGVGNAGSIFKNPPGDFAGRLIEACGLKGRREGDAEISPVHANWIVNRGAARCSDVLALVEIARAAVLERFGVTLELEVKLFGQSA